LKEVMNLRILDENPRPGRKKLERIVDENLDKVVKILRDRDYEVLEPRQMTAKKAEDQVEQEGTNQSYRLCRQGRRGQDERGCSVPQGDAGKGCKLNTRH
jgi:hypothetical protein